MQSVLDFAIGEINALEQRIVAAEDDTDGKLRKARLRLRGRCADGAAGESRTSPNAGDPSLDARNAAKSDAIACGGRMTGQRFLA
jgi:hypothetical protein